MAKARGIIKLQGTIDGLNFYESKGKIIVRSSRGGFTTENVLHAKSHVRTRENSSEFGRCSNTGKQFRLSLADVLSPNEYNSQYHHVEALMRGLQRYDTISARGQRNAGIGADTPQGRALLKGFSVNKGVDLTSIFRAAIVVDADGGGITVAGFDSGKALIFPKGATHCKLSFGVVRFDFGSEPRIAVYAEPFLVARGAVVAGFHLGVDAVPGGVGLVLPFLKVRFFQEVGGELYAFNEKECGVLGILGVV